MTNQSRGNFYTDRGVPVMGSALWYRLMALESLSRDQMRDMLAYLAGYTEVGWDQAYESAMGKPLGDAEDDAVNDYGMELLRESRTMGKRESDAR